MPENQLQKVCDLLRDFDTAMLVTSPDQSPPRARPMAIAEVEDTGNVWFFTGRSTHKIYEIQENQEVLVVCQKDHSRYISLSGRARLVRDSARARELWKESYRVWFPRGFDDPDLILIAVRPQEAEYWDNQGTKGIRYAFEAAKAYLSGTRPEVREGEQHDRVTLRK